MPFKPINEKNFSIKLLCNLTWIDCNLAQNVRAIRQETTWLDPLVFKTVGKMSCSIIMYHVES